jgi:hypothetical protein
VFVDVKGRALFSKKVESNHTLKINTGFLLNGLQFFEIVEEGQPEPQQELNN